MTLLDEALAGKRRNTHREINDEQVELALAWLAGNVGLSQCQRVLNMKSSANFYTWGCSTLRYAYSTGKLQITGVKP